MENGSDILKPLVTRASTDVKDDTFVKRLEDSIPVAEGASGTEERASVTGGAPVVQRRAPWCGVGCHGVD